MTNAAKEQQRYIILHVYNLTIKTELGHWTLWELEYPVFS